MMPLPPGGGELGGDTVSVRPSLSTPPMMYTLLYISMEQCEWRQVGMHSSSLHAVSPSAQLSTESDTPGMADSHVGQMTQSAAGVDIMSHKNNKNHKDHNVPSCLGAGEPHIRKEHCFGGKGRG